MHSGALKRQGLTVDLPRRETDMNTRFRLLAGAAVTAIALAYDPRA